MYPASLLCQLLNGHRAESTVTQGAEIHSVNEIEEMPNEIGIERNR